MKDLGNFRRTDLGQLFAREVVSSTATPQTGSQISANGKFSCDWRDFNPALLSQWSAASTSPYVCIVIVIWLHHVGRQTFNKERNKFLPAPSQLGHRWRREDVSAEEAAWNNNDLRSRCTLELAGNTMKSLPTGLPYVSITLLLRQKCHDVLTPFLEYADTAPTACRPIYILTLLSHDHMREYLKTAFPYFLCAIYDAGRNEAEYWKRLGSSTYNTCKSNIIS